MRIALAASEMVPYLKVGGLGDVIGALPKELARLGHDVAVFLPRPPDFERKFPDLAIETIGESFWCRCRGGRSAWGSSGRGAPRTESI